uniref:ABC transporter domain-containing protein n=1 Tax=Craspedostauros australis TaxID=1486917 RepID=A0A6T6HVF1_9STRA
MVVLRNLQYSRGTANVRVDHLELKAGVYALTGANGSGKSTLFRVLMSCSTNERSIDLSPSITLHTPARTLVEIDDLEREAACEAAEENATDMMDEKVAVVKPVVSVDQGELHPRLSITMPSSRVVEISQTFYWPLYTKPIDWIYQRHIADSLTTKEITAMASKVAEELYLLEFTQTLAEAQTTSDDESSDDGHLPKDKVIEGIIADLLEEKEDWFSDLSGGQKSKVELVRKVFLHDECPHVLLIDETMAPLDPSSKVQVMSRLKNFCHGSVMIVIYHTDVGQEQETEQGELVECVPSNNFFDGNIHVEHQMVHLRPVC